VVGLGHIAQTTILPAFAHALQNSTLAALISDDPKKLRKLSRRYGLRHACSFGGADRSAYEIVGTNGSITLDPAYEYAKGVEYVLRLGKRKREKRYEKSDQFAPELIYFSDCILHGFEPEPSGEEGIADVRVIEALNRSIETGRWVSPELSQRRRRPTLRQDIRRPGIEPPPLVGEVHPATM
jgi:predicted dehydrogenase